MAALASHSVWQQARKVVAAVFAAGAAPTVAPPPDRWAGRRVTVLGRSGDALDIRDAGGREERLPLSYGAAQTIDAAAAAHGLPADAAGLMLEREMFCLEGLPFWRWAARGPADRA